MNSLTKACFDRDEYSKLMNVSKGDMASGLAIAFFVGAAALALLVAPRGGQRLSGLQVMGVGASGGAILVGLGVAGCEFAKQRKLRAAVQRHQKRTKRNLVKAWSEHGGQNAVPAAFAEADGYKPDHASLAAAEASCKQGLRFSMEDAHDCVHIKGIGTFWIVADGHGDGGCVAKYAAELLPSFVSEELNRGKQGIDRSIEIGFSRLQTALIAEANKGGDLGVSARHGGACVVMTFLAEGSDQLVTATLGDSEATLYRKTDDGVASLPLSCVRDWNSEKDRERAGDRRYVQTNPGVRRLGVDERVNDAKRVRVRGLNLSRSVGDLDARVLPPGAFSIKPKITRATLQKGDRLMLRCDGSIDYPPAEGADALVAAHWDDAGKVAGKIVDGSLSQQSIETGVDNVTVMVQAF